ncbi:hypothetical protein A1Q2_00848 [Trichosporon asahii var. asahii CBS 8904]|uniref:F-box domain-containing protein n=1 Tax=Trichosporon asahii var. asahii (strain CBS 8904) TaxID=1220162 RepID=K1VZA3_TRIAC|nr:hypothetical protein A1Q2_00848 [Trichosporon asahii var. asahii CBS 8904]
MPSRRDHRGIAAFPAFPVEILSEIFSHLDPSSVRRVLCVNSLFRTLARPLAYQYGTVTNLGLFFPGAQHVYPYSRGPGPSLPVSELSMEEQETLFAQLKRIDITAHPPEKCDEDSTSLSLNTPTPYFEPQVINLELNSCSHDDGKPTDYCQLVDELLHAVGNPTKLVIRGFPSCVYRIHTVEDYTYSPDVHVCVLYSQFSRRTEENQNCGTHANLGSNELSSLPGRHIQVVFWTARPGQAWLPPCEHYEEHRMSGFDYGEERTVWRSLAISTVYYRVQRVTVVNAAAVLPRTSFIEQHELKLKSYQAQLELQAAHSAWFQKELVYKAVSDNRAALEARQEFLTMEEWIKRGGWEDVFTPEEMQPWLRKMRGENM